jgi:hypothetical protein
MKPLLVGLLFMVLAGPAIGQGWGLERYIGRPVSDLAIRLGPPTQAFVGPDGQRIFQWRHFGSSTKTVIEGVAILNWRCTLSVESWPARNNPSSAMIDWIIHTWKFSGLGCI